MTALADVVVNTLINLDGAASAPPAFRPGFYKAAFDGLDRDEVMAVAMVLTEGNRHGPDAARALAGRM